jgi:hypothetical protein
MWLCGWPRIAPNVNYCSQTPSGIFNNANQIIGRSYDGAGNMASLMGSNFTYDAENRITTAAQPSSDRTSLAESLLFLRTRRNASMGGASLRGTQPSSGSARDAARGVRLIQRRPHLGANAPSTLLDWQFYATSGGRERWISLLAEPEKLAAIRALQRGTFTGRPVGSPEFVARLEQELGRPWRGAKASALAPNPCSPSLNNLLRTIYLRPRSS